MLAVLLFAALVATAYSQSNYGPGKPDVKIIPHPKTVVHEDARHVHKQVHLVKQVPVHRTRVQTIINEVPRIVTKPKKIKRTRIFRQYYPVDVPVIRRVTYLQPVHLERKVPVARMVVKDVPHHVVRTKKVDVPIDVPIKKIVEKKVVRYVENKIFRPRPVVQEKVRVVHVPKPFPVDRVIVQKNPRPRIIVEKKAVPVIRHIHTHKKQAVAVPRVKTVAEVVPNVVHQKVTYPVGKGGGSVQIPGGPLPVPEKF
uniref:Mantle protein n=1 Tax=Margaritifera margaritifera TaxID=102329 RepID=MP_PINMG|nr:RecName: Full=Mantle protein; Short=MP; Flags: Precursor [Pinctada margaritifera]CCE46148.1 mp10 protein [Pinctada margaritifera]